MYYECVAVYIRVVNMNSVILHVSGQSQGKYPYMERTWFPKLHETTSLDVICQVEATKL